MARDLRFPFTRRILEARVCLLFEMRARDGAQVDARRGWQGFGAADFENLAKRFPVIWILTHRPSPVGLVCSYQNEKLGQIPRSNDVSAR
jgi:hypothetical protein